MRVAILLAVAGLLGAGAIFALWRGDPPKSAAAADPAPPKAPPLPGPAIDAAQIATGRLTIDRLPREVTSAMESYSEEIVRTADEVKTKQARITGTCAPGSAIRIISEDGSVRCQALPKGIVSVPAVAGIPRLSTTVTEAGNVPGGTGRYQTRGDEDYLIVPVSLPDGAVVTSFTYVVFDGATDEDSEAFLYRSDDQALAAVSSEGSSGQVRVFSTDEIALRKIDAARYAYFVYFQTSAKSGPRLMPISASVAYRLP